MLAITLDIIIAFALASYLRSIWFQIPLAAIGGVVSTVIALIVASIVAGKENVDPVRAIVLGVFLNPLVACIALMFFRRKKRTIKERSEKREDNG